MRFHVLGIGSIGTLISHHLRLANPSVPISLISRRNKGQGRADLSPEDAASQGLYVHRGGNITRSTGYDLEKWHDGMLEQQMRSTSPDGRRLLPAAGSASREMIDGSYPPDSDIQSLIVCLKTGSTVEALTRLKPRISPSSVITLIQNGMGVFDELCAKLWPDPITRPHFILGTTTHGARTSSQRFHIQHNTRPGEGDVRFGIVPDPRKEVNFERWLWGQNVGNTPILSPPVSPILPIPKPPRSSVDLDSLRLTLEGLLSMSQLSTSLLPMPHLHHQLLLKLAINSVINPLTAVLGGGSIPNGALFGTVPAHRMVRQLATEVSKVIMAYLHSLSAPMSPPSDVRNLFSSEGLEKRVLQVIRSTAANTSSMAADVSKGHLTEMPYINGYLISLGQKFGVETPLNLMLYDMVRFTSDLNSLTSNASEKTRETALQRINLLKEGHKAARTSMSQKEVELEQHRLELEERKVWLAEERLKEDRAARREAKHAAMDARKADLSERYTTTRRRRDRQTELQALEQKQQEDADTSALVGSNGSQDVASGSIQPRSEQPDATVRQRSFAPSSSPPPKAPSGSSWMDQMISSAPRQENTWTVPTSPPTARGPVPKKRPDKNPPKSPADPSAAGPAPAAAPASLSMSEMMSAMINSAPRQASEVSSGANQSPSLASSTPTPSTSPSTPESLSAVTDASPSTSHSLFASAHPSSSSPRSNASSIDSLISSAPRAERAWSDKGGTISGYTGESPSLASSVGIVNLRDQSLARGGIGNALDNLIAASPRMERTYDSVTPVKRSDKGRFSTSRSSGS